jgi:hypothetical protein
MSLLSFLFVNNKVIRIDPLICILKLGMLSFLPEGTKLSFYEDKVTFQHAGVYQGITRFAYGDKRDDIHNLLIPIYWACIWYSHRYDMRNVFIRAVKGLELLKSIYRNNQIVYQCLHYYISVIESHKPNDDVIIEDDKNDDIIRSDDKNNDNVSVGKLNIVKNEIETFVNDDMTKAYICYQDLWSEEEISILSNLFNYLSTQNDKDKITLIQSCIENFLLIKSL